MERVATFRVLFADTDAMGVAYHANYLKWFEAGRVELMRKLGMAYRELTELGVHLPVTELSIRYASPARYDDVLHVHASVRTVGRASLSFRYRIDRDDGTVLAEGESAHAFTDGRGRATRPPAAFLLRTGLSKS